MPLFFIEDHMGLFSSKTKVIVDTHIQRAVEDKFIPDSKKTGLFRAIRSEESNSSIASYMLDEYSASIGTKLENMYRDAKRDYAHGLPSASTHQQNTGWNEVQQVLNTIHGRSVELEYVYLGDMRVSHLIWEKLVSDYGYIESSNVLPWVTPSGKQAWIHDISYHVPGADPAKTSYDSSIFTNMGTPPQSRTTPYRLNNYLNSLTLPQADAVRRYTPFDKIYFKAAMAEPAAVVTYTTDVDEPGLTFINNVGYTGKITVILNGYDYKADYFQVKYYLDGQAKYWSYRIGSGIYPLLDGALSPTFTTAGTYFPNIHFRWNKYSVNANKNSHAYKSTKKLAKIIGMDLDSITENVNANPDIDKIDHAFMTFAIPANSTDPVDQRYLFDFFDRLNKIGFGESAVLPDNMNNYRSPGMFGALMRLSFFNMEGRFAITIQDAAFKMVLSMSDISKTYTSESIGPIGTVTGAFSTKTYSYEYVDNNGDSPTTETAYSVIKVHTYKKQVAPGLCAVITVDGLTMKYYVEGGHYVVGSGQQDILLIPLDMEITKKYDAAFKEKLYARSMHFVFCSLVIQKIKWYQTGFFKALIIVVGIVIAVFTGGAGSALSAAMAAGTTAAWTAFALIVLENIIIGLTVSYGLKLVVRALGVKAAAILAVVAVIVAVSNGLIVDTMSLDGVPWAKDLLNISTGLMREIGTEFGRMIQELGKAWTAFEEEMKGLFNELKKVNDEMLEVHHFSPFIIFGEKPDDFYNRTVHAGNIGVVGIEAIEYYVDNALKLPDLKSSIGAYKYGT